MYFLFSAGLPGDVVRKPKKFRRRHDVIVSEDRGVTLAQVEVVGLCRSKCVFFI